MDRRSPAVSPNVVAQIFIIQNARVMRGILLICVPPDLQSGTTFNGQGWLWQCHVRRSLPGHEAGKGWRDPILTSSLPAGIENFEYHRPTPNCGDDQRSTIERPALFVNCPCRSSLTGSTRNRACRRGGMGRNFTWYQKKPTSGGLFDEALHGR